MNPWQSTRIAVSVSLEGAFDEFLLSRQENTRSHTLRAIKATERFYRYTLGYFLRWLGECGIRSPAQITPRDVRMYLVSLNSRVRPFTDWTINGHMRGVRAFLIFCHRAGYMPEKLEFKIPKPRRKRLPALDARGVDRLLAACTELLEKALILLLVDTGLRRQEACDLNWRDVDLETGRVEVICGKGGKDRVCFIGPRARRALQEYKDTLDLVSGCMPVFQSRRRKRYSGPGLAKVCSRIGDRAGIHVTPHALRRTCAILSLRAGMDSLHLMRILGHEDLSMVEHYAQMVDQDLMEAHIAHGPIEHLSKLARRESHAAQLVALASERVYASSKT